MSSIEFEPRLIGGVLSLAVGLAALAHPIIYLPEQSQRPPQMHAKAMADALIAEEEKRPNRKANSDREKKGKKR